MTYRKRPLDVEAVQWTGENEEEIQAFAGLAITVNQPHLLIETREGTMLADPGDWVIRGIADEYYPCKPEIFEASYFEISGEGVEEVQEVGAEAAGA